LGLKRIIHFIDSFGKGGAENLLLNTINGLTGCVNYVVYLQGPETLRDQLKNGKAICLNMQAKKDFFKIIRALKLLIKEHRIDIVHSHSYWTNILARFATTRGTMLFNSYHFADYETNPDKLARMRMIAIDRLTFNKRVQVIAVSDYVKSILETTCGYKNISVLKNFVSPIFQEEVVYRYQPLEKGHLRFIAFGNLKKEKNYELIIEAFHTLKDDPVSLDVFGTGASLQHFQDLLQQKGILNLRFKGMASITPQLLRQYDAYVMTSYSEACPLSPIEAMSSGLPLILSDIPSLKEVAGVQALFFQNQHPKSFTELIQAISAHPKQLFYERDYAEKLKQYSKEYYFEILSMLYQLN
jgi:glycosyltransferase involved in cell wall biosynthesis